MGPNLIVQLISRLMQALRLGAQRSYVPHNDHPTPRSLCACDVTRNLVA